MVQVDPAGAGGEGAKPARGRAQRRLRVLVVDDEEPIRVALRIILERRGHEVVLAGNVAEGQVQARAFPPDVALVDLRLPGSGLTLLRELERTPALAGRTVLVTGSEDLLLDENGQPVWPRWLSKPFDFSALIALVERTGAR